MSLYQHLVRFHPTYPYPATDAEILADPVHLRMCATVFYRPEITAPIGGRKGFSFVLGSGFLSSGGLPTLNYSSNPNFPWIDTLLDQGYALWSVGYLCEPLIGGTPPTSSTPYPGEKAVWYPDLATAQAALPGLGCFDPSKWRYDDTTKTLRLRSHPGGVFDPTDLDFYHGESSMVHWLQWVATEGASIGVSPAVGQDMVLTGRSAGAHLTQFLALGNDRSDPEAPGGSRYAKSTRVAGVVGVQNVATWRIYQNGTTPETGLNLPHFTDYSGGISQFIGTAKATVGPNDEDQIALASSLYFADKDPDTALLNSRTPVYMRGPDAFDGGFTVPAGKTVPTVFTYAALNDLYTASFGGHPAAGTEAMRLMLQGLTPPTGEFNIHSGGISRFFLGVSPSIAEEAAEIVAFVNAAFALADPGFTPEFPTSATSTAKGSYLYADIAWGEDPDNAGQPFLVRITDTLGGLDGYALVPTMELEMPREASGVPQDPARLNIPQGFTDLDAMARGTRYPKATVVVTERLTAPEGQIVDERVILRGFVRRALLNPKGASGRTMLEVSDELSLTEDATIGLLTNQFCRHTFGKSGCRTANTNLVTLTETATVQSIVGKVVTLTGLATIPSGRTLYWQRGSIRYAGLSMTIRAWSSATPNVFQLSATPPPNWVGKTVAVQPGCLKTPDNCGEWDNQGRFLGIGLAMPTYQPDYQQPPG